EQACVIPSGTSPPLCGWGKVFPRDGRTCFPRHQLRTIVASESPVLDTITAFALWRIEKIWCFCNALVPTRMREARSSPAQMTYGNKIKQDNGCTLTQPSGGTIKAGLNRVLHDVHLGAAGIASRTLVRG